MTVCETPDFMFPMQASVYHPIIKQGDFGAIKKQWVLDRVFACSFSSGGSAFKEEVKPNVNITLKKVLIGRIKKDVRFSEEENSDSITNVIITNIRNRSDIPLYVETSGTRAGKSTIYEIESQSPIIGPFGDPEYFALVVRRSENQASDI